MYFSWLRDYITLIKADIDSSDQKTAKASTDELGDSSRNFICAKCVANRGTLRASLTCCFLGDDKVLVLKPPKRL